jgi:hypothetical protein
MSEVSFQNDLLQALMTLIKNKKRPKKKLSQKLLKNLKPTVSTTISQILEDNKNDIIQGGKKKDDKTREKSPDNSDSSNSDGSE